MKEYEIKQMQSGKYNIYYYGGELDGLVEFYAYSDGIAVTDIRIGYILKVN